MQELLIFNRYDELLTILSNEGKESCLFWNAPFKETLNNYSTFEFTTVADHEASQYIVGENKVAFMDKDNTFRLFVIKEPLRSHDSNGPTIRAVCEPEVLELNEEIIEDIRPYNTTRRDALTRALQGTRWQVGSVADSDSGSTNFYYENVISAINKIIAIWGGEIRDRIEVQNNVITARYIDILYRRGDDTGKIWENGKDIISINETVLSYPVTALYGRGSSLEITDEDGEATGGYSRKITFADVEWKVANGDPVDKPLGQAWVGDPEALEIHGRLNADGTLRHRKGIHENGDIEDPETLLLDTWNALQERKHPSMNYEMDVFLLEEISGHEHEKVRLGDTTRAIDRMFAKPIEVEARVISYEYDVSDPENTGTVEMGSYINRYEDSDRLDALENAVNQQSGELSVIGGSIVNSRGNTIFFGRYDPHPQAIRVNDIWYEPFGENDEFTRMYIWNGRIWEYILSDEIDPELLGKIEEAQQAAQDAVDKANESMQEAQNAREEAQSAFDKAVETASDLNTVSQHVQQVQGDAANALGQASNAWDSALKALENVGNLSEDVQIQFGKIEGELSAKISQDVFDELEGTVQSNSTQIVANAEAITQKADLSIVNTLTGEVQELSAQQTIQAGLIEQKVTATDVQGMLGDYATLDFTQSLVSQEADRITQSVTNVQSQLDNLSIGTRNIALNGNFSNDLTNWRNWGAATGTRSLVDITNLAGFSKGFRIETTSSTQYGYAQDGLSVINGKEYILSAWVYVVSGTGEVMVQEGASPWTSTKYKAEELIGKWTRISHKFTATVDKINIYVGQNSGTMVGIFTGVQLEQGNLMSDFTPAIEEMATITQLSSVEQTANGLVTTVASLEGDLVIAQTQITTLSDSHTVTVQRVDGLQTDVSSVVQLANGLQTTVATLEGDLTTAQTQITTLNNQFNVTVSDFQNLENSMFNLISNASMEAGIDSWRNWGTLETDGARRRTTFSESNLPFNAGIYVKRVETGAQLGYAQDNIAVKPNTTYTLSAWYRATTGSRILIQKGNGGTDAWAGHTTDASTGWEWKRASYTWTTGADVTSTNVYFGFPSNSSGSADIGGFLLAEKDSAVFYSQFTQLADVVNLRVQSGDVINQINISPESIVIDGSKLHITAKTYIDAAVIKSAMIESIDAVKITTGTLNATNVNIINLNASNIATGELIGIKIRSSSNGSTFEVQGAAMSMTKANGDYMTIDNSGIYWHDNKGDILFQSSRKITTSDIFGTAEYNAYLAAYNETRSVTYASALTGSGHVDEYEYVPHRASTFYGQHLNINAGMAGSHIYIRPASGGGELRVTQSETIDIFQNVRAAGYFGNRLSVNGQTTGESLYLQVSSGSEVRVESTGNPGNNNFQEIRTAGYFGNRLSINAQHGSPSNLYVQLNGELRVENTGDTNNGTYRDVRAAGFFGNRVSINGQHGSPSNLYLQCSPSGEVRVESTGNAGNGNYRPIRASAFTVNSLVESKQDIELWEESALGLIRSADIHQYRLKSDVGSGVDNIQQGLVIGMGYNTPIGLIENGGISQYKMGTWAFKGIQELANISDNHAKKIEWLEIENQYLKQKIANLEAKVA